jgi:hypothetical protein
MIFETYIFIEQELRNPFSIPRIVGEVTIWAHLGPGKLTRNKKVQYASADRLKP